MLKNRIIFAFRLKKMAEALTSQIANILVQQKIDFEPRALYILMVLKGEGIISISETAALLGMTHPAVVQLVNHLVKVDLINQGKSVKDKRKTLIQLTEKGESTVNSIEPVLVEIHNSIDLILNEIDPGIKYSLSRLEESIGKKLLLTNVLANLKERELKEVRIIPFRKEFKADFIQLNNEWLEKYFDVEEEDKRILNNPEKEIINKGGEVFFALLNEQVVGTCAVQKVEDGLYELAKMAVAERARGKQIEKKLALTAIGYAVDKGARKLKLSTSPKLVAALNLYRKLGFINVVTDNDHRYRRELIHMELELTEG